jgi:hypothetical protein
MIQKLKSLILAIALPVAMAVPVVAPLSVHAAAANCGNNQANQILDGAGTASGNDGLSCDNGGNIATTGVGTLAKKVVDWLSWAIGIISIIMIIFAGFKYITSGGESSNVSGAKNTLIYAIVGLVLVVLAQVIVKVVLSGAGSAAGN